MKKALIIAAALMATLPMAHASSYLFTSGTAGTSEIVTVGGIPITVWGYTFTTTSGSGSSISLSGGGPSALSYDSFGLGVGATSDEITTSSFVVIDFADATPAPGGPKLNGATTATFNIDNADSGWIFYGGNTAPGANSITGLTSLVSGTGNNSAEVVSLVGYSYLAVVASGSCELNLLSVTTNTTPEPGTFVMAGMALIGLGVALGKARKRQ